MTGRLLQTFRDQGLGILESSVAVVPNEGHLVHRLAVALIAFEGILLVAVALLRGQHPPGHDELNFLEIGLRMLGTKGNPQTFIHGSLFYDLMAALHGVTYFLRGMIGYGWESGEYLESYIEYRNIFLLVGRLIVVMFSIFLLVTVYRLAQILYGRDAGLLAIALLSFGVILPLTGTCLKEDLPASALATCSVLLLCDASIRLRLLARWSLAGALCGAAIAAKYTIAPLVIVPLIMALGVKAESPGRLFAGFMGTAGATFLAFEPYVVVEFPRAIEAFQKVRGHHFSGGTARAVAPLFLGDYLPFSLGVPLVCGILAAAAIALFRVDMRPKAIVAYLAVIGAIFMWATGGMPRYVITLAPLACIVFAGEMCRWRALSVRRGIPVIGLALLLTWPANIVSLKFIALLSRPDTRHQAQAWIEAAVPAGSRVLLEGTASGEPTFTPALVPSEGWFKARLVEVRAAGTTGRIVEAAAVRAAKSDRPRYDLVEKAVEDVPDLKGIDYLVLSEHHSLPDERIRIVKAEDPDIQAWVRSRKAAMGRVESEFSEIFSVSPFPDLRFDWFDRPDYWRLWSAPLQNYENWKLGPIIKVYRRRSLGTVGT